RVVTLRHTLQLIHRYRKRFLSPVPLFRTRDGVMDTGNQISHHGAIYAFSSVSTEKVAPAFPVLHCAIRLSVRRARPPEGHVGSSLCASVYPIATRTSVVTR